MIKKSHDILVNTDANFESAVGLKCGGRAIDIRMQFNKFDTWVLSALINIFFLNVSNDNMKTT